MRLNDPKRVWRPPVGAEEPIELDETRVGVESHQGAYDLGGGGEEEEVVRR